MPNAQQLGRYHLLDRIAYGGMAEIFRAATFDAQGVAVPVAIKRVLPHLLEDPEFLTMLIDEARIASLVTHENVARVYELGHVGTEYYLAMEFVEGKDLRTILERYRGSPRGLPPVLAAYIASGIAEALAAVHDLRDASGRELHVVHRDVSPSNVLCGYDGAVKLCDFGIAKGALSQIQTRAGVIKGKVKYMSPEQAVGRQLDGRSDLFALGSVLYEMLVGRPPFSGKSEMEVLIAIRDLQMQPLREALPDVPQALDEIVTRAMSRARTARFPSAHEIALALRAFVDATEPGFGRESLAAWMRQVFATEWERERKRVSEYTFGDGDRRNTVEIGENLIADVLPQDAPWTQFTPYLAQDEGSAAGPAVEGGAGAPTRSETLIPISTSSLFLVAPDDLPAEKTVIEPQPRRGGEAEAAGSPGAPAPDPLDVHGASTQRLLAAREPRSVHEEVTHILDFPPPPQPRAPSGRGKPDGGK